MLVSFVDETSTLLYDLTVQRQEAGGVAGVCTPNSNFEITVQYFTLLIPSSVGITSPGHYICIWNIQNCQIKLDMAIYTVADYIYSLSEGPAELN